MDKNEKYSLADLVIEHALKGGANQVSVNIYENRSNNIEIRDQKIDSLKNQIKAAFQSVFYVDKKYSAHSTNRMNKDELFRFIDEAINATRFLAEDEFRSLPDPALYFKGSGPDLNTLIQNWIQLMQKPRLTLLTWHSMKPIKKMTA